MNKPEFFTDMSERDYRAADAMSKSDLSAVNDDIADWLWSKSAPVDEGKVKTLDIGKAAHCKALEPELFNKEFVVGLDIDRRSKANKEAWSEFESEHKDKTIITADDNRRIDIMVDSIMAHPRARMWLEMEGYSESSIFWTDEETGIRCKCRPDRMAKNEPLIFDLKTADDIGRFIKYGIHDFQYFMQDAHYSDGHQKLTGDTPLFGFIVVSKSANCGRYPVKTVVLSEADNIQGMQLRNSALKKYKQYLESGDIGDAPVVSRSDYQFSQTERLIMENNNG
jgi:exodeoxyribonuclease VIII